jgi:mRNA-degrading endonuclease toxin of MazEF toxin-antitoxin module
MKTTPATWHPRRGEIYMASVDKRRPVIVISRDSLNAYSFDVCVVPVTRVRRMAFSFRPRLSAREGGLWTDSWAKCDQLATIPKTALEFPPTGALSSGAMEEVTSAIKLALQLS